jgi:LPXTG-motif cell wall-anchored protein
MKKVIKGIFLFFLCLIPALAGATPYAYIPNKTTNNVSVIDTATDNVIALIPVGNSPMCVAVNPSGSRVYVTNQNDRSVTVIETSTNTVVATIPLGTGPPFSPFGLAVNPSGTRVYVVNQSGSPSVAGNISVIDTATNIVIATIPVGANSVGVAVSPSGNRVYVTNNGDNSVSVINTTTNTVISTVAVANDPWGIAVNPSGSRVYVVSQNGQTVSVIDTTTNTVIAAIPTLNNYGCGIAVNPSGTRVYVNGSFNVLVIDTATNTIVDTISLAMTFGISVNPSGTKAYAIGLLNPYIAYVIDIATNTVITTIPLEGTAHWQVGNFIGPESIVNTPSGSNVTVTFSNGTSVKYDSIASACNTTFTDISNPTHNPPPNFNFIRYGYFDISTDCNYIGPVTVVYPYNESEIRGQEQNLKLFHWKNNGWEDCTVSVDTLNNKITGRVTSLSDFGMGYYYSSGGGGGGGSGGGSGYSTGANENMIALIAILAISAGVLLIRKRRMA